MLLNSNASSTTDNPYLDWYHSNPTSITVLIQIILLLYLFVAMSVVSQYFLCPVIAKICKKIFNVSDTVAGVTLMAWANGSNDFLSCSTAFMTQKGSLALAELIGAGVFLTTFALGCIVAVNPLDRIPSRPFVRDVFFLSVLYLSIYLILRDGVIWWYEALALLLLHVFYVAVVLIGRQIYSARQYELAIQDSSDATEHFYQSSSSVREETHIEDNLPFPDKRLSLKKDEARFWTIPENVSANTSNCSDDNDDAHRDLIIPEARNTLPCGAEVEYKSILSYVFTFPIFRSWHQKNLLRKAYSLLEIPSYILCIMTIPSDDEFQEEGFDEYLLERLSQLVGLWHLFVSPISFALLILPYSIVKFHSLWISLAALTTSAVGSILSLFFRKLNLSMFLIPKVCLSVAWTYWLAKQLVLLLGALSQVFQISNIMLGTTLFAFGNSIGDLITNLSMASLGHPKLAIFACFGNPLVNLSFGISLSCFIYMISHQKSYYNLDNTVSLSALMLCCTITLVFFGFASFMMDWKAPKWLGIAAMISYLFSMAIHLALELGLE